MQLIGWGIFAMLAVASLLFVITSVLEQRWRPARRGILIFVPALAALMILLNIDPPVRTWVVPTLLAVVAVSIGVLTVRYGRTPRIRIVGEQQRLDERDAIFHRFYRLKPGIPEFDAYYAEHPEKREFDDKVRAMPQLASPGSRCYDPSTSPFQNALADVLNRVTREIDWPADSMERSPVAASPEAFGRRIKGFARYVGADLVGTTRLNPTYIYSHIGRSPGPWGAPIELSHTHAVAIATEMSYDMVRHGPDGAITTETTLQYFEVAKIAMAVARYINFLGYDARAHVDGNYRVLCGPIAVDAGLGELGRIGLLMTREYGPRVRLSIVTTNLALPQDEPIHFGVQHFCTLCKKCATCCPSASIDDGAKGIYNGVEKWRTNQETCYRFWRLQGSDCGICMRVCPYSHPGTPMHNVVRWAIRRNPAARRVALWADDLFYGRRPTDPYPLPSWHAQDS
jgi:ferredoxin